MSKCQQMLINVKMPTIVGILTFMRIINTSSKSLKARKIVNFHNLVFMLSWNIMLSWVEHEKCLINLGPGHKVRIQQTSSLFLMIAVRWLQNHKGNLSTIYNKARTNNTPPPTPCTWWGSKNNEQATDNSHMQPLRPRFCGCQNT